MHIPRFVHHLLSVVVAVAVVVYIWPKPAPTSPENPLVKLEAARGLLKQAEFEAEKSLTDAERDRNRHVRAELETERLEALSRGLPAWVAREFTALEIYGREHPESRPIAWGTGRDYGRTFEWFGYTSPRGELMMATSIKVLSVELDELSSPRSEWVRHYCTYPDQSTCDVGGAFERYVFERGNMRLGLILELKGCFPPPSTR